MLPVSDLTVYTNRSEHQSTHATALAEGLRAHGIKAPVIPFGAEVRTRHVACWGWRQGLLMRNRGHEVLVMERGYIGDRFHWASLGWNGLNGRATHYPSDDPSRFEKNFGALLKPWRDGGDYVLLIGQVPGDASLGGMDLTRWYEDAARDAAKAYGLPVRFRPHPVAAQKKLDRPVMGAQKINGTLAESLSKAAVAITFNSNTAVESVLAGVPTVATDMGSMAAAVTSRRVGDLFRPDRTLWASRLAWCQWEVAEFRSGAAWEGVCPR